MCLTTDKQITDWPKRWTSECTLHSDFHAKHKSCSPGIRALIFPGTSTPASHENRFIFVQPFSSLAAPTAHALHTEQDSTHSSVTVAAKQYKQKRCRNSAIQQPALHKVEHTTHSFWAVPCGQSFPKSYIFFIASDIPKELDISWLLFPDFQGYLLIHFQCYTVFTSENITASLNVFFLFCSCIFLTFLPPKGPHGGKSNQVSVPQSSFIAAVIPFCSQVQTHYCIFFQTPHRKIFF